MMYDRTHKYIENTVLSKRDDRICEMSSDSQKKVFDTHAPLDSLGYIVNYYSMRILVNHTICCTITVLVSVLTVGLNFVTFLTYWKSTQLQRKMTNFLIFILSLNDLAVGFIVGPLYVLLLAREITLKRATNVINYLNLGSLMLFTGMSFETMIVVNCERYLGIVHPIFHKTKVTKERLVQCLLIIWFVGGAQTILLFYYGDFFVKLKTIEVIFFMILLLYMYVKIYATAQKSTNVRNGSQNRVQQEETSRFKDKCVIQNVRLAKSCFLVVISCYICFLPASIIAGVIPSRTEVVYMAQIWSQTFLMLNSSFNSILFFWKNYGLRKEALTLIGCTIR